jgi:DNA-binding transcriptional ArsR family regulator
MEPTRDPPHPAVEEIDLSKVYDALSDATRRRILLMLEEHGELNCSSFLVLGTKTAMSYHLARLRESGLTRTRVDGTQRFMTLRRTDLDRRFPGLLAAMLKAMRLEERRDSAAAPKAAAKKAARKPAAKKTAKPHGA